MTRYRIFWASLFIIGITWVLIPSQNKNEPTKVRLFCAYGKVFIEFEEKHNTWGTMWLDTRGNPMPCNDHDELLEERTSEKNTI